MNYTNMEVSDIFLNLINQFKEFEKHFSFLNLPSEEYKKIIIKEIINLKKNNIADKDFVNKLLSNIKITLDRKTNDLLKLEDSAYQIIDNYINNNSFDGNIKLFDKLNSFLINYNAFINPDVVEKLLNNNKKILLATKDVFNKNSNIILTGKMSEKFDNFLLLIFLETYCMINNLEIEKNDLVFPSDIEKAHSNEAIYFSDISPYSLLSREEEFILANKMLKGDQEARNLFINSNLRLVVKIAKNYTNSSLSFLDLIQEGNIGLIIAADHFDPLKGYRFSTYASGWINQRIRRAIVEKSRNVRMPYNLNEKLAVYLKTFEKLQKELCRDPKEEEIAQEMGVNVNTVRRVRDFNGDIVSLNMFVNEEEDTELQDLLLGDDDTDEYAIKKSLASQLKKQMDNTLSERDIKVLMLRYGFGGREPMTLENVGKIIGVSRERVRQIEERSLRKLRKSKEINSLAEYTDDPETSLDNLKLFSPKRFFSQKKLFLCKKTVEKYILNIRCLDKETYLELLQKKSYNYVVENLSDQEIKIIELSCLKDSMSPDDIASLLEISIKNVYDVLNKFNDASIESYLSSSLKRIKK